MAFHGIPQGIVRLPPQEHPAELVERTHIKGTYILVGVFLTAFIVYYFVNWKLLSFVWKIG
jgi:hypothetical protein